METNNIGRRANMDVSHYELASLDVVPLVKLISNTSSTSSEKEQMNVLKKAMRSIFCSAEKLL